jgi:GNAT superfamily N-acetyltransferase
MLCPATALEVDEDPFEPEQLPGSLYFGLSAVEPEAMGGGYGRRLPAETERIARERGYTRVVLSTVREFGLVEYYGPLGYALVREVEYPAGTSTSIAKHHCGMVKAL